MAIPTIDGTAQVAGTNTASVVATPFTTTVANDIILVAACSERQSGQPATATVTSVTCPGLTFTRLAQNNALANPPLDLELWTAQASSTLSSASVTVNWSGTYDDCAVVVVGIAGASTVTPWDLNASLPATNQSTSTTTFSVGPWSTTNANDLVLFAYGGAGGQPSTPSGFTFVIRAHSSGGAWTADADIFTLGAATPQSGQTVTTTPAANFGSNAGFVIAASSTTTTGTSSPQASTGQPCWDVPTPTGTLQGAAAFSWDGATWQPSGRAYASVATPTGVLRGVALFNYSGGVWTPSGAARPGVPTPTGTLDGVAVYTWSGSAWTPAGGAPDVPTPSGTLQGVAAFYWDGTNWQPTGQAASEVATPNGVLQGMAMFSLVGGAWAPTVSPASLDLNFVTMTTLDPSITFTRASTATYFDANGVMQTTATNVARLDHDPVSHAPLGLLIEESRENWWNYSADLSNSATSKSGIGAAAPTVTGNQSVAPDGTTTAAMMVMPAVAATQESVCAQGIGATTSQWVFSAYLKGAVGGEMLYLMATPDGVTYYRTACTLTTSWQRFSLVTSALTATIWYFQIGCDRRDASQTAVGPLTCFVWGVQAESGAFLSSYIPTASTGVVRAADVATIASIPGRNASAETYAADYMLPTAQETNSRIVGSATTTLAPLFANASSQAATTDGVATLASANAGTLGAVTKAASTWASPNAATICLNGGAVATAATLTTGFAAVTSFKFMGDSVAADQSNGWIRRFRYWPRVLTSAQLQQVTT